MDKVVSPNIPGLENLLRGRDLPVICRLDPRDPLLHFYKKETSAMAKASSLILNTFHDLESSIISNLSTIFPKVYTIGPLHSLFRFHIPSPNSLSKNNESLRDDDKICIAWLNSHELNTVLYVSFGTVACSSRDQILEFWHGLVNSGKPFLWVLQEDSVVVGDSDSGICVPAELEVGTKERGFLVDWAPQEEVLAHPTVDGFLSHAGWNSTLEGICEGVPMICWPLIADQMVFDMNRICNRVTVEKMVRDLMENNREEINRSMIEIARMTSESVKKGGSSCRNLEELIEDIRSMSLNK